MAHSVSQARTSYVVVRPRASDAIGGALREAYGRQALPDDMLALLGRLNGAKCRIDSTEA